MWDLPWQSNRGRGTCGFFPLGSRQRGKISKSTAMSQMVQSLRSPQVDGREQLMTRSEILPWWRPPHGSPLVWIPTLPHPSCVIIGNVLSLSEAQVPYLNNGNMNALLGGLLGGLNEFLYVRFWEWCKYGLRVSGCLIESLPYLCKRIHVIYFAD